MAAVPFAHQWFSQWSPPSHILNSYSYHQFHTPEPQQRQNVVYEYLPPHLVAYEGHDPFRNQQSSLNINNNQFGSPSPGLDVFKTAEAFPSRFGDGSDSFKTSFKQDIIHTQPKDSTRFQQSKSPSWNNKRKENPKSMARILPALLLAGLVRGNDYPYLRGDQMPDSPDPDRDLGGPSPLRTLYQWKLVDFEYESDLERRFAMDSGRFIPLNTLPLGLEVYKNRIFVTFPRWKDGVPCTLATLPRAPNTSMVEAKFKPYPNWSWHHENQTDCNGLFSVFRLNVDSCGRLWILDSGQLLATGRQVCPPQIIAFDLNTDRLIGRWTIPERYVLQNSLFTNLISDLRGNDCKGVHIYFCDVWRFSVLVFRLEDEKFWRFTNHYFFPDPLASDYTLHGINFQWTDGVFSLALTPVDRYGDRTMYFHPMSSHLEFKMPASLLRNETAPDDAALLVRSIKIVGEDRGINGQSSTSAIAKNGVMFYNLVLRDSVGCWDLRKPYVKSALGVVAQDMERLNFPNDLKVDHEEKQSVWILSNKLPTFSYRSLNPNEVNFRIMREYVDEAIEGSVCDPKVVHIRDTIAPKECLK